MLPLLFSSADLPQHNNNLLIVKIRPTAVPMAASIAAGIPVETVLDTPGLSRLALLERAGLVKGIVPLGETMMEPQQLIVPSMVGTLVTTSAQLNTPPIDSDPNAGVSVIELESDHIQSLQLTLASDQHIEFVSRVPIRYLAVPAGPIMAAVPPSASTLWNLQKIQWAEACKLPGFKDAADIRVAVLDTGVDTTHPDLSGRIASYVSSYTNLSQPTSDQDLVGHGTHVSGIIGAVINNQIGINGICASQILAWKIFDDTPTAYSPQFNAFLYTVNSVMYYKALAQCLRQNIDVVNLSIAGPAVGDPQETILFKSLIDSGTVVVAAMGNERPNVGNSPIMYPAAHPGVIAVGATSLNDTYANFSNGGQHITLCAPGVAIWSTLPTYSGQTGFWGSIGLGGTRSLGPPMKRETDYDAWQGTSMAAPHVTGAVALLRAKHAGLSPASTRTQLMQTADPVPDMGGSIFTPDYGAGRLNLLRLLM
jgi:subtilisin family serine protease